MRTFWCEEIAAKVALYSSDVERPEEKDGKRIINLDDMKEADIAFLRREISPIIDKSFHNLSEEDIEQLTLAIVRTAYNAAREGVNIFKNVEHIVLPIEAQNEYTLIAGQQGILIDREANIERIREFLYEN